MISRRLTALLATAVAVSVVHYADNYANLEDYPQSETLPNPSATVILLAWFAFTAAGVAGWLRLRRGDRGPGLLLLAIYSGSGLVGFGHYAVEGALDMPWWRHAHVVADIACGLAILAVVIAMGRRRA